MSERRCECGTMLFWDDENREFVCFPCAEKEATRLSAIESAERAIVEAADKWRDNLAYADRCELELAASVDAWRKLRDAR